MLPTPKVVRARTILPIFNLSRRSPLPRMNWRGVASMAVFGVIVSWIVLGYRRPAQPLGAVAPHGREVAGQQLPFASRKQDTVRIPDTQTVPGPHPSNVLPTQVVSPPVEASNEDFDYEDVAASALVRQSSLQQQMPEGMTARVLKKSDDVTVRYFDSPAKPGKASSASNDQVRNISDDVTVRYFQKASSPQGPE